jgi:hypothetical protein
MKKGLNYDDDDNDERMEETTCHFICECEDMRAPVA